MKTKDICFTKENSWFRYRTGAFILKDDKMLFVKSKFGGYFYMIGGGVGLGETSVDCIEREILEETGIHAKVERLAVVAENFFKGENGILEGLDCHTIEFYYLVKVIDASNVFSKTDDGEELVWIPIEEIKNSFFKPSFIPEKIDEIINGKNILHIIEERDR
ncbi:MAG: NUDIX domain-containing protein [Treponemataceae bacterium]|nr:NUDIX domain-containing protein [Treponemataceae bacterium]